jgi:hypothetical protein
MAEKSESKLDELIKRVEYLAEQVADLKKKPQRRTSSCRSWRRYRRADSCRPERYRSDHGCSGGLC